MIIPVFDFGAFPVASTPRLILRQLTVADAPDVLVFRGDPHVQRFNSAPLTTLDESIALIGEVNDEYRRRSGVTWAVVVATTNRTIGIFGLRGWERHHCRAEVGYDLAKEFWGRGLAAEALGAILTFGFREMDLNRIEASTIADNHESIRLLDRAGFVREGTRREYSLEDDAAFHDGAIYGLLRREFRVPRADAAQADVRWTSTEG